jgi:hypothetical protein
MIGIPFRWIKDDATTGMDCCVVNLDLGLVSAEQELFYDSKYLVLGIGLGSSSGSSSPGSWQSPPE